jgi:predicted GIY-YIG superfamily endonuclease
MIEITIDESVKIKNGGIYIIVFSDGRFYIGSTIDFGNRISTHKRAILSNFKSGCTCLALRKMKGFTGSAKFSLIEKLHTRSKAELISREYYHIGLHRKNPLLLNDVRKSGNRKHLGVYIDIDLYNKICQIAKYENIAIGEITERLINKGLE